MTQLMQYLAHAVILVHSLILSLTLYNRTWWIQVLSLLTVLVQKYKY
jgi:hypothetical protein